MLGDPMGEKMPGPIDSTPDVANFSDAPADPAIQENKLVEVLTRHILAHVYKAIAILTVPAVIAFELRFHNFS